MNEAGGQAAGPSTLHYIERCSVDRAIKFCTPRGAARITLMSDPGAAVEGWQLSYPHRSEKEN